MRLGRSLGRRENPGKEETVVKEKKGRQYETMQEYVLIRVLPKSMRVGTLLKILSLSYL